MNEVMMVRVCKLSSWEAQEANFITGWNIHGSVTRGEARSLFRYIEGLPWWLRGKESACQEKDMGSILG